MGTTSNMSIPYPESSDYVADGATAMENIATQVDAKTGMILLGSYTGTSVSSLSVDDIFTSTFSYYRIICGTRTLDNDLHLLMRASSSDSSTSYNYGAIGRSSAGTTYTFDGAGITIGFKVIERNIGASDARNSFAIDIYYPANNEYTTITGNSQSYNSGRNYISWTMGGFHGVESIFDGFTLECSGNFSHTTNVYGYSHG